MKLLLYAHAKNFAILKEAVINFIVEKGSDILQKVSLKNVPCGLFANLLTAVTRNKKSDASAGRGNNKLSTMWVSDLCKEIHERGLDNIDGSRKTVRNHTRASGGVLCLG